MLLSQEQFREGLIICSCPFTTAAEATVIADNCNEPKKNVSEDKVPVRGITCSCLWSELAGCKPDWSGY